MSLLGKIALWLLCTGVAILVVDDLIGRFKSWRDRRDLRIRDAALRKWCITVDPRAKRELDL